MKSVNYYLFVILVSTLSVVSVLPNLERIWADEVIGTVSVGPGPIGIVYNQFNGNLYVANNQEEGSDANTVSVIDGETNTVIDTIDVGRAPYGVAYNYDNHNVYVTNGGGGVSVIDGETNTVIDTIDVGQGPVGIAYNPDNGNLYVANINSNTVSVIDGETNTVIDTIDVGSRPYGVTYNFDNNIVYVANYGANTVTLIKTIPTPIKPIANAGPDQAVDSGDQVQLDGSGSSGSSGGTLTYQWTQTQGPEVTLSDSTSVNPTFTAPNAESQQNLEFQLVVINEQGLRSEPNSMMVTVNPNETPTPPPFEGIVNSGNNVNIQVRENSGNNVGAQSGFGGTYSDSPILQDQSTEQRSQAIS